MRQDCHHVRSSSSSRSFSFIVKHRQGRSGASCSCFSVIIIVIIFISNVHTATTAPSPPMQQQEAEGGGFHQQPQTNMNEFAQLPLRWTNESEETAAAATDTAVNNDIGGGRGDEPGNNMSMETSSSWSWSENSSLFHQPCNNHNHHYNDDDHDEEHYIFDKLQVRIIFFVLYTIVFCLCFFGNLAVVLVVTIHPRMRGPTKFCLGNLAFANLCVGVFCIYQNLSTYFINWIFGNLLCKMYHFINCLSHTASVLILVVICVERYMAVLHPLKCKRLLTIKRLRIIILWVWIVSILLCSPRLYYFNTMVNYIDEEGREETICVPVRSLYNSHTVDTINFVVLFLLPLLIIVILYTRVGLFLWRSSLFFYPAPKMAVVSKFRSSTKTNNSEIMTGMSGGGGVNEYSSSFSTQSGNSKERHVSSGESSVAREPPRKKFHLGKTKKVVGGGGGKKICYKQDQFCGSGDNLDKFSSNETSTIMKKRKRQKKKSMSHRTRTRYTSPTDPSSSHCDLFQGLPTGEGGQLGDGIRLDELPTLTIMNEIFGTPPKTTAAEGESGGGGGNDGGMVLWRPNLSIIRSKSLEEVLPPPSPSLGRHNTCQCDFGCDSLFGQRMMAMTQETAFVQNTAASTIPADLFPPNTSINSMGNTLFHHDDDDDDGRLRSTPHSTMAEAAAITVLMNHRQKKFRDSRRDQLLKPRQTVVHMMIVIVLTFGLLNLPYHLRKLLQNWYARYNFSSDFSILITPLSFLLMYCNCAINPILFAWMSKSFRTSFKDLVQCRLWGGRRRGMEKKRGPDSNI